MIDLLSFFLHLQAAGTRAVEAGRGADSPEHPPFGDTARRDAPHKTMAAIDRGPSDA
jgi:hypothetical protein